jgi:hypothetical protein
MLLMISGTFYSYSLKKSDYINNSISYTIALDKIENEQERRQLKIKLRNITFQDVNIVEKDGATYVTVKCPPEKFESFSKWIFEKYKRGEK